MLLVLFILTIFPIWTSATSIFCMIHTATPSHDTRARTINATWAQRCDGYIFFTNSEMDSYTPHVFWPEMHTRDHSWEKIRRVFNHVIENIPTKYDWYLRADDDAYVIVENLRSLVSNYSPKEPHFLGYKWNFFVRHGFADGASYVLSRPAAEAFNTVMKDTDKCPDHHRAEEDQEIARCLAAVGIYPEDTRDSMGSDRFHHFHPFEQLTMFEDGFSTKYSYYPSLPGMDNFSRTMISFHHISPYEMQLFDYLLYKVEKLE